MKRAVVVLLAILLTAATLWFMSRNVRTETIAATFANADWALAGVAFLVYGLVQWLRAWRFALLTTGSVSLPRAVFVSVAFRLNFLNFVIPFRIGELGYPVMMHREYGQAPAEAIGTLLLARVCDLAVVSALILGLAAWHGVMVTALGNNLAAIAACIALAAPFAFVLTLKHALGRVKLPAAYERYRAEFSVSARKASGLGMFTCVMVLTLASWLTFGVACIFAANSVSSAVPPLAAMFGAAAGNLAFALPVNGIAGLGSSQAAWVLAVTWAGCSLEAAVVTALSTYLLTLASALAGGGLAFLLALIPKSGPHLKGERRGT
jgi:hypothetical protein